MFKKLLNKFNPSSGDITEQRNIKLFLSIFTAGLSKIVSIGATLITIPVTLSYLGAENFGVWMVISGVVGFMGFTDLGVGMGLQNALSKSVGENDSLSSKYYIANSYFIVTSVAILLSFLVFLIFNLLPVKKLFNVDDQVLLNNAVTALKYSLLAFLFGMPVTLVRRVLGGLQKTYIANNVMLVGSIFSLLAILTAVYFDLGLTGLAVLFIVSPTMTLLLYSVYFFYKNSDLKPRVSNLSKEHISPIVSAGAWTVFVQIIYVAKMNIPIMIISASLGLLAVAEYSVAQKLIGLSAVMIGMALQPLWVVYGEAYHRGDRKWVENTLKKSIKLVLILTVIATVIFQLLGQSLITLWLGDKVAPSRMLIAGFSLWMIASSVNICFAMLLNGIGYFKRPGVISLIFVGASLLLCSFLVDDAGVEGVILIMFLIAELLRMPFNYIESKRVLRSIKCF